MATRIRVAIYYLSEFVRISYHSQFFFLKQHSRIFKKSTASTLIKFGISRLSLPSSFCLLAC